MNKIPFNKPYMTGKELDYIKQAYKNGHMAGDGDFTKKCSKWLENVTGASKALLTHSCTAALEMAAIMIGLGPGDEVIMPSYTFVSTANAFVLRGATPVFVDIREDTLNIDENKIEAAITPNTKAIVPVHYAGVACEMDKIMDIAKKHNLFVIEDAAQALFSEYKGQPLGAIGDLGCFSFHETKNVISGEGGALIVNDPEMILQAEIVREKGTDRSRFFRGEVDKYTWQNQGSSYLPGEIISAFLWAQLQKADKITEKRLSHWKRYYEGLKDFIPKDKNIRLPIVPKDCKHNAHMFYILLPDEDERKKFIAFLKEKDIHSVFHYVPLHNSPAGKKYGIVSGEMTNTDNLSSQLVRLPLWYELTKKDQMYIKEAIKDYFSKEF